MKGMRKVEGRGERRRAGDGRGAKDGDRLVPQVAAEQENEQAEGDSEGCASLDPSHHE